MTETVINYDFASMSYEQLVRMEQNLAAVRSQKQSAARTKALEDIVSLARLHNFDMKELNKAIAHPRKAKAKGTGTLAKAKYMDPATGNTWSGRGASPKWLRAMDKAEWSKFLIQDVTPTETAPQVSQVASEDFNVVIPEMASIEEARGSTLIPTASMAQEEEAQVAPPPASSLFSKKGAATSKLVEPAE